MPRRQSPGRRWVTAAGWPAGILLTSWHYLWRTTPMRRREEPGVWADDAPPPLPQNGNREEVQRVGDGAGAFFHRRYRVSVRDSDMTAEQLVAKLAEDPDQASPSEFARFKKVHGHEGRMEVGDEYEVRMPGPWDGPVRVVEREPRGFRLATLNGHLEAGQIRFSAADGDALEFTIESWARSGDRLSDLMYDRLRMSKEVQFHMWTSFLERVVKLSGGRRSGALEIVTRRVERPPGSE